MIDISAINKSRALRWHPMGLRSWSMSDWSVALGGEVGEILEIIEVNALQSYPDRPIFFGDIPANRTIWKESLAGEIGDVYAYLDLLAQASCLVLLNCMDRPAAKAVADETVEYSIVGIAVSLAADNGKMQDYIKKLNRERDGLAGNRQSNSELWAGVADRIGMMGRKLERLAEMSGLNLESCVREKFNAVSCRMNLPERL